MFVDMHTILNEDTVGGFKISKFTLTESDVKNLRLQSIMSRSGREYYDITPGIYVRLTEEGVRTWMSDTQMERRTNVEFINNVRGHVLIAGLGIGLLIPPIIETVKSITIIEKNKEVIDLISPNRS